MLRIVITGGPGAGKTALIAALAAAGHATVAESARAIIAERRARGLPPRPDPPAFAREILRRDIDKYNAVSSVAAQWVYLIEVSLSPLATYTTLLHSHKTSWPGCWQPTPCTPPCLCSRTGPRFTAPTPSETIPSAMPCAYTKA
jgi:hypothetical protein